MVFLHQVSIPNMMAFSRCTTIRGLCPSKQSTSVAESISLRDYLLYELHQITERPILLPERTKLMRVQCGRQSIWPATSLKTDWKQIRQLNLQLSRWSFLQLCEQLIVYKFGATNTSMDIVTEKKLNI